MKHLNENSMKKCFLLMAGIILLAFTACQSDELANGGRNGEVAVSFSVPVSYTHLTLPTTERV